MSVPSTSCPGSIPQATTPRSTTASASSFRHLRSIAQAGISRVQQSIMAFR
ncbi:MAG TPA: hypothetical protein VGV57_12395 [Thermoleophilaceae bacterium]|nr:hypothetical protein [Thermoleophilaceae bacterium]